ncbi:MAG: hypothetical protein HDS97_03280 [Bacteroidales bacterium]|nr:hypothetical protein [Bacteroidales bacterium]MBD5271960.1 hypothetical protein [Bacteroides sp.]MDE6258166.1 hypothetical protein [Muribaculaceae bacterium]
MKRKSALNLLYQIKRINFVAKKMRHLDEGAHQDMTQSRKGSFFAGFHREMPIIEKGLLYFYTPYARRHPAGQYRWQECRIA